MQQFRNSSTTMQLLNSTTFPHLRKTTEHTQQHITSSTAQQHLNEQQRFNSTVVLSTSQYFLSGTAIL
jgi:hypothetical protein